MNLAEQIDAHKARQAKFFAVQPMSRTAVFPQPPPAITIDRTAAVTPLIHGDEDRAVIRALSSPSIRRVVEVTCRVFDVRPSDVISPRRTQNLARPRRAIMFLCCDLTQKSISSIGRALQRDHSTVCHSLARTRLCMAREPEFAALVARARAALEA